MKTQTTRDPLQIHDKPMPLTLSMPGVPPTVEHRINGGLRPTVVVAVFGECVTL